MYRNQVRFLSTKIQRTPEQLKEALKKVEKYKKFKQHTVGPKSITWGLDQGRDLHQPKIATEVAALSGMPAEHANRTVIITQRILKTLQSGTKFTDQWQLYWKSMPRWTNPLMGWTSSADPLSNLKLNFDSKDAAIAFATKQGWNFEVMAATTKTTVTPGTYQYKHNFLDTKTIQLSQKQGMKCKIWENPVYGESHWFMPLKYHGNGEVVQHGPPAKTA